MSGCRLIDATAMPVYDLGINHPFARDRQKPLFDLIQKLGWASEEELLQAPPATDETLHLGHDPAYVDAVRLLSAAEPDAEMLAQAPRFGLGNSDNPVAPGQHDAAAAVAEATVACVEEVMAGRAAHAFNPTGGLHHAMFGRASGFCIYNDLVIAIRRARKLGAERVLYVDFDVHHGDGVEFAFHADPSVMTISFHESPDVRFPGTGRVTDLGMPEARGTTINVPLASYTGDTSWLRCVRDVLVPLAENFRPDLIVSQHGCDPHREDPLAELHLTTDAMHEAVRITRELAGTVCGGRWVATGGGGYQPVLVIPRVWGAVWAIMSGRELPDRIDPAWVETWSAHCPSPLPDTFTDEPRPHPHHEHAARINERTVAKLQELLERGGLTPRG